MNLELLINQIEFIDNRFRAEANKAVNRMLTIRNWLIGYYIVEYEQNGEDRAKYGTQLLAKIAFKLQNIKGLDERSLRYLRQFYHTYDYFGNSIWGSLPPDLQNQLIRGSVSPELQSIVQKQFKRRISLLILAV